MKSVKNSQYCLEGAILGLKGTGKNMSEIMEICTLQDYLPQNDCSQLIK